MVVDKARIEKEAKEILDKFAKALEKSSLEKTQKLEISDPSKIMKASEKIEKYGDGSYVDREEFERVEGDGKNFEEMFKKRMLENAPNSDDDFVIAETGGWK